MDVSQAEEVEKLINEKVRPSAPDQKLRQTLKPVLIRLMEAIGRAQRKGAK